MIRISLGNVGSGKTASEVREMLLNTNRKTYTNVITKVKHVITLRPDMIIEKRQVSTVTKRSGESKPVYESKLNLDFWKGQKDPINVVLDEAHSILNSRRAMSKTNIIMTDWIALLRRVLGHNEAGYGELVFITQLDNRIDVIARDMARQIRYHVCHYVKECRKCKASWRETSEMPEQLQQCPRCHSYAIRKFGHVIEVWKFSTMERFRIWKEMREKTYYEHYFINDIERIFPLYDTLQWDNLFSENY